MNCRITRERLLTAEPGELDGRIESELASHLRDCAQCRRAADLMLEALRTLVSPEPAPGMAAAAAARRAVALARTRDARARWVRHAVPLAAAASLAGILLLRRGPSPFPIPSVAPVEIHDVTVTAPPGRSLAVLHTDDPGIVVIWFF
jgi:predicted anti-sigma-YlaC factor YlaD